MSGEKEDYSSESFLEDEPTSSKRDYENTGDSVAQSPPFYDVEDEGNKESFSSAVENLTEVSFPLSPPGDNDDHEDVGVGVTCMSTIDEESKSCYESSTTPSFSHGHRPVVEEQQENVASSHAVLLNKYTTEPEQDLNSSAELREFQQLVNETEAGLNEPPVIASSSSAVPDINTRAPNQCHGSEDAFGSTGPPNVEELLRKLEQIQSTQDILEQVINTDVSIDAEELNLLISQLPLIGTPLKNTVKNGAADHSISERSVSAEIASIQRIIEGGMGIEMIDTSNSTHSEVAGGNNLLSEVVDQGAIGLTSPQRDRAVDDVFREYEELERSLSRASLIEESFRSDISSLPALSTYSNKEVHDSSISIAAATSAPAIKPPVFKSVVPPPPSQVSTVVPKAANTSSQSAEMASMYHHSPSHSQRNAKGPYSSQPKPMMPPSHSRITSKPKSSRVEGSHLTKSKSVTHSARPTTNVNVQSSREITQDAYKPRNRRMRSPRVIVSPRQPAPKDHTRMERGATEMTGAGESYGHSHHHQVMPMPNTIPDQQHLITERTDYAVAEALKTIQKLSTMVERQETLLEAYSKDNERLWTQLKDSKAESLEKESGCQDVINSLRTELATLKLNRLVKTSTSCKMNSDTQTQEGGVLTQPEYNKAELERFREDAELKSQQLMELRKEVLLLQSKLAAEKQSKALVPKPPIGGGVSALVFQEKEKDYQKEINALKKQVRTLQKILYSKDNTAPPSQQQTTASASGSRMGMKPLQRTKSDIVRQNANTFPHQALIKNIRNTGVDINALNPNRRSGSSPVKGLNLNTSDIIQASLNCMDQERYEFENIIEEKNKSIFEKERMILNLKEQVEKLKGQLPEGDVVEPGLVDELRSRIITQNKAIQSLKQHLSTFKKLEAENLLLREDKSGLEQQIQEVKRKLDFAQHLVKPENEVLCLLSEKVDELNSRYHHRERQLDTLLSKLTLKTTTGGGCGPGVISSSSNSSSSSGRPITTNLSPRRIPFDQFSNNNGPLGGLLLTTRRSSSGIISDDILHMADFSPSNSFQLYNCVSDLPEM